MLFLTDEILRLRAVEPSDAELMWEFESDSSQWRDNGMMAPFSRKNLREYAEGYDPDPIRCGQLRLIIESTETQDAAGNILGIIDLFDISATNRTAFVGIYVKPDSRCKSIASRSLALIERYASQLLNLRILAAKVSERNMASRTLFEKNGYTLSGELRNWLLSGKSEFNLILYSKKLIL